MPPFVQDVQACFRNHNRFVEALGRIARGREDNGRPLSAETARQLARDVMLECGIHWPRKGEEKSNA